MKKMRFVYFIENKDIFLSRILDQVPNVDDEIRLKGRRGKVLRVEEQDHKVFVYIQLEKKVKKPLILDDKRKRR